MENTINTTKVEEHKRNRQLERESNLLKDELCTMKHVIHLLDNIKRVSRECINHLHMMVEAVQADDKVQVDQLKDDVEELEDELREWERKYHVMNQIESRSSVINTEKIRLSGEPYKSNKYGVKKNNNNNNNNNNTNNNNNNNNYEMNEMNGMNGSCDKAYSDKSETQERSVSNPSIIPQEFCEISMETYENEQNNSNDEYNHGSNALSINNGNNSPPPISVSSSESSSPGHGYHHQGKQTNNNNNSSNSFTTVGQFTCEFPNCNFRTNIKQRLVMHKRLHAGELLFSCDIPGCDYQSNYKGNIKIHKKHRHKVNDDSVTSISLNNISINNSNNSQLNNHEEIITTIVNKQPLSMNNNTTPEQSQLHVNSSELSLENCNPSMNIFPRRRRRKNRFRLKMVRGNVPADCSIFVCEVKGCKYRTKWKQCLTAHQLLHAGVKPYKCDYPGCSYSTNFKGNVNVHKRVHRTSTNDDLYKCQAIGCDFTTPWKNSFMLHQRNHLEHNGENNDISADDYSNLDLEDPIHFANDIDDDDDDDDVDDITNHELLINTDSQDHTSTSDNSQHNSQIQHHNTTGLKIQPTVYNNQTTTTTAGVPFNSQHLIKNEYHPNIKTELQYVQIS